MFTFFIPDFLTILLGYLVSRYTFLNRPLWKSVESLVYYLFLPVFLFSTVRKTSFDIQSSTFVLAGSIAFLIALLWSFILPYIPILGKYIERQSYAAAVQIGFRFNALLGLAIVNQIFGVDGVSMLALLLGVLVPFANIFAVLPMAKLDKEKTLWQEILVNPLIWGLAIGLLFNFFSISTPVWFDFTLERIGKASLVLGLMSVGAGMTLSNLTTHKVLTAAILMIRHFLVLLCVWPIAIVLDLSPMQSTILAIFSALPTASSSYVLAAKMGYNSSYVATVITLSTVLGMLSLMLAVSIFPPP